MMMALAAATASCGGDKQTDTPVIGKQQVTVDNGLMTPEALWAFGRIGTVSVSPDGQRVAYTVSYYSIAENKGNSEIFVMNADGSGKRQLTRSAFQEAAPRWMNDSQRIAYLSNESGSMQAWMMNADGSGKRQLTDREGGITDFAFSPDETRMLFIANVPYGQRVADLHPDLPKATGRVIDDLMYRHWDEWTETVPHPFVADFSLQNGLSNERDLLESEPYESPVKPFGGIEQVAWSRDGKSIAYTSKKLTGTEYAITTDSDIYVYDVTTGETVNINKAGMPDDPRLKIAPAFPGYDKYPVFSPDDRYIAFQSMRRGGNEADKTRLFVWDSTNGSFRDLTEAFDYNATNVVWSSNEEIMFIAPMNGTHQICTVSVAEEPQVKVCTKGDHDITRFSYEEGVCVAEITTQRQAAELFRVDGSQLIQLTFVNKEIYDHITMGEVQKRWIQTTDGKQMLTWVILPPNFDPNKKYPTLLYCEGGPQSVISQMWSYRWNFQLMAAQGYVVVAPNRRGTVSFGQEWTDQISGDYSGQNIQDYLAAIDQVSEEPWVDKEHRGCVGASYGGYSVYYLAGVHEGRFKAFISHCGIFDFDSMYGSTEELFFMNHEYGGPYWDKTNATAVRSYAHSPHRLVQNWDTPIMIITGLKDFRIPYTQSLEAFTAARVQGIPARLVAFEEEGHQVFQPQNSLVWNREFFGWLDKYLK